MGGPRLIKTEIFTTLFDGFSSNKLIEKKSSLKTLLEEIIFNFENYHGWLGL